MILLLPSRHTDDTQALWRAAIARGLDVRRVQGLRVDPNLPLRNLHVYVDGLTADVLRNELQIELVEPPYVVDGVVALPYVVDDEDPWVVDGDDVLAPTDVLLLIAVPGVLAPAEA